MFLRLWTRAPRTAIQSWAISIGANSGAAESASLARENALWMGWAERRLPLRDSEGAVPVPVGEIQQETGGQPDTEPLPRLRRQPFHDVNTGRGAAESDRPHEPDPERPGPVGILVTEHEHADADDGKREQRPDVREVVDLVFVHHQRA